LIKAEIKKNEPIKEKDEKAEVFIAHNLNV